MATVQSLVKRSLRLLTILQIGEEPTSQEADDLVEEFNAMMNTFDDDGIKVNYSDLAWTDTFPYEKNHENAVVYMFAINIAPSYGKALTQEHVEFASRYYSNLRNFYANPEYYDLPADSAENAETYF